MTDDYYEELQQKTIGRDHRIYYYILAINMGKRVLLGPYLTEEEANSVGYQKLDISFEVIPLNTKSRSKATQMLKARVLDETANLEESLGRVKHKVQGDKE